MKIKSTTSKQTTLFIILAISFATLFLPLTSLQAATLTDGMDASYVVGAGSGTQDFTNGFSGTSSSEFTSPGEALVDTVNNRVLVADAGNNRVLIFNLNSTTKKLDDYTADNVLGQADFTSTSANRGGSAATNTFSGVRSLAWDASSQYLFASDLTNNRILVFDLSGGITDGMDATYVLGQADFSSTSGNRGVSAAANTVFGPEEVHYISSTNTLVVSDAVNHRVLFYDTSSIINGEAATNVLGQADFTSSSSNRGGSAGQNTLHSPAGLAFDSSTSYLYVAEGATPTSNARIMIFDVSSISDGENAINVLGQPDFVTTGATTTQSGLGVILPGLFIDETNNRLFVADSSNARIMIFDVSSISDGENAINVLGQSDFITGMSPGATQSSFFAPTFSYFETTNDYLYVADGLLSRILIFDLSSEESEGCPSGQILNAGGVCTPSSSGFSYTHPPLCTANITPNTITKGELATLSWNINWPTDRQSNYYMKVPKNGIYSHKVNSITINPEYTTTYNLASINMWGANFCNTTVTVLDEEGTELTSPNNSYLSASAGSNPFFRAITSFFARLFVR
ncbi:hypothetical protein GW765_01120 [Candidatus Parcubacteria bacterium]|nr:hypothetical protein [Candidatus Parcubacteria bacterium]